MKFSNSANAVNLEKNSGLERWEEEVFQAFGALFKSSAIEGANKPAFFGIKQSSLKTRGYART